MPLSKKHFPWYLGGFFLFGRLVFLTVQSETATWPFYQLAEMGWPYLDLWVEYPPIFPFLSKILFYLAGGTEHAFGYMVGITLALVHGLGISLFALVSREVHAQYEDRELWWVYLAFALILSAGGMSFDVLALTLMLLGIYWALAGKDLAAGVTIGIGMLSKWFPVFALVGFFAGLPKRRALTITLVAFALVGATLGVLYAASPEMTVASLKSQLTKGSWETVWALLDGNYQTGNFGGPLSERLDPSSAGKLARKPAVVPGWMTLVAFGAVGLWELSKVKTDSRNAVSMLGLTWCLFGLWTPGWTPAWVVYIVPFVLLALPRKKALLFTATLTLISLLEWPVLLTRGRFDLLPIPVIARTALLALLAIEFARNSLRKSGRYPLR
ncbi:DUF2029 domain-containing protein [Candidatus Saccharibacteria bacterium]|nr:DUF2029 domain-containing protein [Candidatus Saccharibacteria bacterium]